MASLDNELFYSRLPVNEIPLAELLGEEHLFYNIPENWHVIITDIRNSTQAVSTGMHETVNLVATGCIVAVLNIAYRRRINIPFFFGGDGAGFIVPPSIFESSLGALLLHKMNVKKNFNLDLRVGSLVAGDINSRGHELRISKLKTSSLFSIPVLLGDGLAYAEQQIKGEDFQVGAEADSLQMPDLEGMQCRWDRIKPPHTEDEVLSLLVMAGPASQQPEAFSQVITLLDTIYGSLETRKPISIPMLKLKGTIEKIGLEMKTRFGRYKPIYLLINMIKMWLGHLYFRTKKGRRYLQQLVALSDTLVIDGRISTVISGTSQQRQALETALRRLEEQGIILYGLYVSRESVMSCYVRNLNEDHVHFVDGADGGYTRAAEVLKKKLVASS